MFMVKMICFEEKEGKPGVIRFVSSYQRRKWYRRERIDYTIDVLRSNSDKKFSKSYSEDDFDAIRAYIKKDFPEAKIYETDFESFVENHANNRFWVICTYLKNGRIGYYCDNDQNMKAEYTEDLTDVRMIFSESSAYETFRNIQRSTRDRVWVMEIYLNLTNELLTPVMMITCTSRKTDKTKYFARLEGNRVRLVNTSDAAARYPYEEVIKMYEYLLTHNKNFLFAVMPTFKDNVNCRDMKAYIKDKKISRMIAMDMKLRYLRRVTELKKEK